MLPGFYERHYARPQIGRAGRAVVAGETKLYDEASGQYHYIRRDRANQAREGVWASMIDGDALGPPDIPPSPPRGEAAAPVEMEPLPPDLVYDATAEERRQKMKARGLADLEAAPSKLPAGDGDALGSRARRVADVPAAALLRRQWKKLAGIIAGARVAEIVLWHDGDAVPHPAADLITRCRLIAAEQPTVNVWMGPGDPEFHGLPFMRDEHFYGATVRSTFKQHYPLHPAIYFYNLS